MDGMDISGSAFSSENLSSNVPDDDAVLQRAIKTIPAPAKRDGYISDNAWHIVWSPVDGVGD